MYRIRLVFKGNCFIITIKLLLLFSKIQPLLCSNLFPFALSAICMYVLDPNTYCFITCFSISWSFFVNSWSCCLHFSCSACNCQGKDFSFILKRILWIQQILNNTNIFWVIRKYFHPLLNTYILSIHPIHFNCNMDKWNYL